MWCSFVISGLLAVGSEGFALAPIRWAGLSARKFVLAPTALPGMGSVPHRVTAPFQKLTIMDERGRMFASALPEFDVKSDSSIAWDAAGLCLEASDEKSGHVVQLAPCSGGPAQLWNVLPCDLGRKSQIQLKGTRKCIGVVSNNEGDLKDASVELQECEIKRTGSWILGEPIPLPERSPSRGHTSVFSMRHVMTYFPAMALLGALSLSVRMLWSWRRGTRTMAVSPDGARLSIGGGGVSLTIPAVVALSPLPSEEDGSQKEDEEKDKIIASASDQAMEQASKSGRAITTSEENIRKISGSLLGAVTMFLLLKGSLGIGSIFGMTFASLYVILSGIRSE